MGQKRTLSCPLTAALLAKASLWARFQPAQHRQPLLMNLPDTGFIRSNVWIWD